MVLATQTWLSNVPIKSFVNVVESAAGLLLVVETV